MRIHILKDRTRSRNEFETEPDQILSAVIMASKVLKGNFYSPPTAKKLNISTFRDVSGSLTSSKKVQCSRYVLRPEQDRSTSNLPAHQGQCLLTLHLGALAGQLLLLVGKRLLHQHHLDALLHGVLFRSRDELMLLRGQARQGTSEYAEQSRPGTGPECHIARLAHIVHRL